MAGINIRQDDQWNFNFDSPYTGYWLLPRHHCHYCGIGINRTYSYIIDSLKEAGYLDEDYKEICCYCKVLEKFGLLDFKKDLNGFCYKEDLDILLLDLCLPKIVGEEVEWCNVDIAIHEFSKWSKL